MYMIKSNMNKTFFPIFKKCIRHKNKHGHMEIREDASKQPFLFWKFTHWVSPPERFSMRISSSPAEIAWVLWMLAGIMAMMAGSPGRMRMLRERIHEIFFGELGAWGKSAYYAKLRRELHRQAMRYHRPLPSPSSRSAHSHFFLVFPNSESWSQFPALTSHTTFLMSLRKLEEGNCAGERFLPGQSMKHRLVKVTYFLNTKYRKI